MTNIFLYTRIYTHISVDVSVSVLQKTIDVVSRLFIERAATDKYLEIPRR